MTRRIKRWLIKHASFNTYLRVAKSLEKIEKWLDLAKYVQFTRTKEGKCLQGTVNPLIHRIANNALIRSVPYVILLVVALVVPSLLPQSIPINITTSPDESIVVGFVTAILTIAGIFITLFYTNTPTVLSNKYPSSSGDIPKLLLKLVSSDKSLNYCISFVVVSSVSFFACAARLFNWLAFVYIIVLTMVLLGKLPSVFSLIAGRTDMAALSNVPASRFLSLARASSFDRAFCDSDFLILNFKKLARNELALLDALMNYSLSAGDYSSAYSKTVNETVLKTLAMYSRISSSIDGESYWHIETNAHKAWFMSSSHELNIAISTGTIPRPETTIDRYGYHKELFRISKKYGQYLIDNDESTEYSDYIYASALVLECCIRVGDIEWWKDYFEEMRAQCLDYSLTISDSSKEDLRVKLHLLEQYAAMITTIPLELSKLCDSVSRSAFHFDSFSTFSQAELQRQGFPLGANAKMKALCEKMNYEKEVFGAVETPKWWFNESVNSIGLEVIEQLCSWVLLLHDRYCSSVKRLVKSDSKSSYILALKEAELFSKSKHCIVGLLGLAETSFASESPGENYIVKLEAGHDELVRVYPDLAKAFLRDSAELEGFFPDLYGFAFFNYCQLLLGDIVHNRLSSFCASIIPLYHLTVISSLDLQEAISKGSYNDIYKAQVLCEPVIFFLELCGMAYVMAELLDDKTVQKEIVLRISSITKNDPNERARWTACVAISNDITLNGKISMDLFSWRRTFLDAVRNSGRYPDVPRYSFVMNWEPPGNKERLLKMLPVSVFDYGDFNGCSIFEKYILGDEGNDQ